MMSVVKGKGVFCSNYKVGNVCHADEKIQKSGRMSYLSILTLKKINEREGIIITIGFISC